jgi:ribosomal protein S18 acetylase RimI-like enzyme
MSTELVPIRAIDAMQFKAVRLAALQDSPMAFGSTYAREASFPDAEWIRRANNWRGDRGIGYLALDSQIPCGIAGVFLDDRNPAKAQIVSMWVAPTHRRSGVGRLLIDAIVAWCREKSVRDLHLMVTSNNQSAINFYKRIGFAMTGVTEPYPNDRSLVEYEMWRPISNMAPPPGR